MYYSVYQSGQFIVWYRLVSFDIVWYCLVLFGIVWYCLVSFGIVWYRLVSFGIIWYCLVSDWSVWYQLAKIEGTLEWSSNVKECSTQLKHVSDHC